MSTNKNEFNCSPGDIREMGEVAVKLGPAYSKDWGDGYSHTLYFREVGNAAWPLGENGKPKPIRLTKPLIKDLMRACYSVSSDDVASQKANVLEQDGIESSKTIDPKTKRPMCWQKWKQHMEGRRVILYADWIEVKEKGAIKKVLVVRAKANNESNKPAPQNQSAATKDSLVEAAQKMGGVLRSTAPATPSTPAARVDKPSQSQIRAGEKVALGHKEKFVELSAKHHGFGTWLIPEKDLPALWITALGRLRAAIANIWNQPIGALSADMLTKVLLPNTRESVLSAFWAESFQELEGVTVREVFELIASNASSGDQ